MQPERCKRQLPPLTGRRHVRHGARPWAGRAVENQTSVVLQLVRIVLKSYWPAMTRRIHTLKSDGPWEYPCRASRSRSLTVSLLAGAESEATLQSARLLPPAPPSSAPLEIFNWSFWGSAKMIGGEMRVTAPYSVEAHFRHWTAEPDVLH